MVTPCMCNDFGSDDGVAMESYLRQDEHHRTGFVSL